MTHILDVRGIRQRKQYNTLRKCAACDKVHSKSLKESLSTEEDKVGGAENNQTAFKLLVDRLHYPIVSSESDDILIAWLYDGNEKRVGGLQEAVRINDTSEVVNFF